MLNGKTTCFEIYRIMVSTHIYSRWFDRLCPYRTRTEPFPLVGLLVAADGAFATVSWIQVRRLAIEKNLTLRGSRNSNTIVVIIVVDRARNVRLRNIRSRAGASKSR